MIANAAYQSVPALENPPRDAALIADALGQAGFEVLPVQRDLGKPAFEAALRDFKRRADAADIALIYYAGHGIELEEQNWLLPIDARIADPADAHTEGVSLSTVLRYIAGAKRVRIVVLDACRNNPFALRMSTPTRAVTRGLRPVDGLPSGTIVAYSASYGQEAAEGLGEANSPFATALAQRLVQPGLEVRFLFASVHDDVIAANRNSPIPAVRNQRPWIGAALPAEEIFFIAPRPKPSIATVTVMGSDVLVSELGAEVEAFDVAAKANSADQWRAFLHRFPNGRLKGVAELSLASLSNRSGLSADSILAARAALDAITPQEWRASESPGLVARAIAQSSRAAMEALAERGDARAQWVVGRAYHTGLSGFPTDQSRAVRLYRQSAAQEFPRANVALAALYNFGGGGLTQNKTEAVRLFRLAAAQGSALAHTNLGILFQAGEGGLPRNEAEAARHYQLAAAQGDAGGQAFLGSMFYRGKGGLAQDRAEAARLFRLAAAQGDSQGQTNLAVMYERGEGGLIEDKAEALRLYRLAAAQGDAQAYVNLAGMYYRGEGGLAEDKAEALGLYRLAAAQGHAKGLVYLGVMYSRGEGGLAQDKVEAVRLYKLAAALDDAHGQVNLARMYYRGEGGLAEDKAEAARLTRLAAAQGDAEGQSALGAMHYRGEGGLIQDQAEALRLFRLAAAQGDAQGQVWLAILTERGEGGAAPDRAEAIRLYRLAARQGELFAQSRLQELGESW